MRNLKKASFKMAYRWILVVALNLFLTQLTQRTLATPAPNYTSERAAATPALPTTLSAAIAAEIIADNNDLRLTPTSTAQKATDDAQTSAATVKATASSTSSAQATTTSATGATAATPMESGSTGTTTLASSNAPATTTTNESEGSTRNNDKVTIPLQMNEHENKETEVATEQLQQQQQQQQQHSNEKQVKESLEMQQMPAITEEQTRRQQTLTTEVPPELAETDMHKQATGNAETPTTPEQMATDTPITATPYPTALLSNGPTHRTAIEDNSKKSQTDIALESIQFNTATTSQSPPYDDLKTSTSSLLHEKEEEIAKQRSLDDFKPLIQEANNRLLQERTIFTPKRVDEQQEWKQNLMPNEVEDYRENKESSKVYSQPYEHNINWSPYLHPATPVVDFTGKVLQEEDGVITEIEEKFRLKEFATDVAEKNADTTMATVEQTSTTSPQALPEIGTRSLAKPVVIVNHEKPVHLNTNYNSHHPTPLVSMGGIAVMRPMGFIERRVKKSFDFPMHRLASDASHTMQHFDFANTKFSSNINEPMQHLKSGAAAAGNGNGGVGTAASSSAAVNQGHDMEAAMHVPRAQPEFSTTKFYNSKELYNEMLQHKNKQMQQHQQPLQQHDKDANDNANLLGDDVASPSLTLNSFAVLHSPKMAKLEELHELREPQKSLAIKRVTVQATKHKENPSIGSLDNATSSSGYTTTTAATTSSSSSSSTSTSTTTTTETTPTKKFHKELKKAKLLIKTMLPNKQSVESNANANTISATITTTTTTTAQADADAEAASALATPDLSAGVKQTATSLYTVNLQSLTTVKPSEMYKPESRSNTLTSSSVSANVYGPDSTSTDTSASTSTSAKTTISSSSSTAAQALASVSFPIPLFAFASSSAFTSRPTAVSTNPTKSPLKPIVRPRILSRLQEKINSLECEIQNVPQDSHLWRGNETHELLLPIMTPENCKTDKDCTAMMVSWEGEAEIQSGDILIVEINDALLSPKDVNLTISTHNTQVYQVTRSGHEHCDVTEGILLDITPLIVDGRKLVTLYDKDLTEGVNLLIVVSELWGSQCVRLKVTTKTENCGENADCSGKGVCFSNTDMEEYECQCCSGFAGPHCEEIDACTPSPCTNNGICVDLSQGHEGNSYQCLCPYGYTGKNCQYELDPCNPAECMNGGSCVGNSTHFRCECTPGFTGPMCQHSLNECESSPCIHGICVDQEDGFRCFCQPGFAGELCNFEYNECESNPCQNGGECIDHIGSYECHCSKGYTGNRCHIKVDFCANKPCPEGRRCIDHGNDFSCECLGGRNGPDCNEMQRTQCNVNPCTHGGTCWSSGDSFYCACRPGYTGTMCEDEFVVETVVSSSEFMVDDTSARNFNDKSFGSSVVLKSPIELHNAYTAAIVLALVIFFVALYLTICHCKVNQTYRKFSTRTYGFLPILGFRWRTKQATSKISRHWLSGKGLGAVGGSAMRATGTATNSSLAASAQRNNIGHLPTANASSSATSGQQHQQQQQHHVGQLNERPFQRHLAMNLENDMYYTVDFSENSQHSPLIQ